MLSLPLSVVSVEVVETIIIEGLMPLVEAVEIETIMCGDYVPVYDVSELDTLDIEGLMPLIEVSEEVIEETVIGDCSLVTISSNLCSDNHLAVYKLKETDAGYSDVVEKRVRKDFAFAKRNYDLNTVEGRANIAFDAV